MVFNHDKQATFSAWIPVLIFLPSQIFVLMVMFCCYLLTRVHPLSLSEFEHFIDVSLRDTVLYLVNPSVVRS